MQTQQEWYGFFMAALLNRGVPLEALVEQHGADQVETFLDAERQRDPSNVKVQPGQAHSAAAILAIDKLLKQKQPPGSQIHQSQSEGGVSREPPDTADTADEG